VIEAAPYRVESCDQVLYVPGKTITDLDDFSQKSDAFFTISFYMVNHFEKKDPQTLKESISLDKITELPSIILGTKSCLKIASDEKSFNICLSDKETAQQILNAFDAYFKCRLGNNLAPASEHSDDLKDVMKHSCLGIDVKLDLKKFKDPNEGEAYFQTALHEALANVAKRIKDDYKSGKIKKKEKTNKKNNIKSESS